MQAILWSSQNQCMKNQDKEEYSETWSDKVFPFAFRILINITQRKGDNWELSKQSDRSYWSNDDAWNNGGLFASFYVQSMNSFKVSRICTHHLCLSLNHHQLHEFAFRSFRSISPCDLLRNSFTLLLQLLEEPKI